MAFALFCSTCKGVRELPVPVPGPVMGWLQALINSTVVTSEKNKTMYLFFIAFRLLYVYKQNNKNA
jgi:hypothetical protein